MNGIKFDLIVTIVNRGFSSDALETIKKAGAEGGTTLNGRGCGIHETAKLFGIPIEPEKEIVLTLIDNTKTKDALKALAEEFGINQPGKGIAFVLDVEKTVGISHLEFE